MHKSAAVKKPNGKQLHNERLEFLGDAILEAVVSDILYRRFSKQQEGFLTVTRSNIVKRETLGQIAVKMGLDRLLQTSCGHQNHNSYLEGNAFEAVIGAIYLDQGYDFVHRLLINKIYAQHLNVERLSDSETDFKSRLIEWCQKNHHQIRFETERDKEYKPNHPVFYTKVLINDMEMGHGAGDSKKEAEQKAAFSVATFMSDEQCASMLDRVDRMERRRTNGAEEPQRMAQAK